MRTLLAGRRTEYVLAFVVFAALFALLMTYKMVRIDELRGDSAMYFQSTQNLASRGLPVSQAQASIVDYVNNAYTGWTAADLRKHPEPLFGEPSPAAERSVFLGHAYFILYPIALFVKIFPVRPVLFALYALTFAGVLLAIYGLLRRLTVPPLAAAAFCVLAAAHPAWWEGLLWGQFYPDRLFILFGFLLMAIATFGSPSRSGTRSQRIWLAILAVACASINERGAITAGLFLAAYAIVYWKKPNADRYYKLGIGIALLAFGLFIVKLLLPTDTSYGSFLPTSVAAFNAIVLAPQFVPAVEAFLIASLPLLILACFEWRAAAVAILLMLPNIFGSIGGAEKTGWSTHYHSFYYPALVWAAALGYAVLVHKMAERKPLRAVPYAAIAVSLLFLALFNQTVAVPIDFGPANVSASFLPTIWGQVNTFVFQPDTRDALREAAGGIEQSIPRGSVVSTIEAGMPLLYDGRTLEFFPKDIDHADYVVLGASQVDGKFVYNGTVSFLPAEQKQIDAIVTARLKRDGYDLAHPKLFPAIAGAAILRRVH